VYLSVRTDGHEGTGAIMDPYNASTQEKFDALFKSFGPNTAIHLGPGTYHTRGAAIFEVKPYWKIRGAGYEVTRIIQDNAKQIGCTVFAGRADGVEIEDLSIDCGFQNQQVVPVRCGHRRELRRVPRPGQPGQRGEPGGGGLHIRRHVAAAAQRAVGADDCGRTAAN
jgi:hypothetical protein